VAVGAPITSVRGLRLVEACGESYGMGRYRPIRVHVVCRIPGCDRRYIVSNGQQPPVNVNSPAFNEVYSSECRLFFCIKSPKCHIVLLTALVDSQHHIIKFRHCRHIRLNRRLTLKKFLRQLSCFSCTPVYTRS